MAKKDGRLAAVVDIGSTAVRTRVAQIKNNSIQILDTLESPVGLGHGTFAHGKIEQAAIERATKILQHDYNLLNSYGIEPENVFTVATTAMREAKNRQYMVDRINVRFNRQIQVLEDGQEAGLIFRETLRRVLAIDGLVPEVFLMAYIGTGNLGVALVKKKNIVYSTNIRTGSLKLSEMLEEMPGTREKQNFAMQEYLQTLTYELESNIADEDVGAFVVTGREVDLVTSLTKTENQNGVTTISSESLEGLFAAISGINESQLKQSYGLTEEQSDILLPSIGIYLSLLKLTNTDKIITPKITLADPLLHQLLFPKEAKELNKKYDDSIIASAKRLAHNLDYDETHAKIVTDFSLKIFNKIRRIHGFTRREKLYLHVAGITHDIGKFLSSKKHSENTSTILCSSNFINISDREMSIIAGIARYHSLELPDINHEKYRELNTEDRLIVSKLSAIIRIADALDRSHKQKFEDIELELTGDTLYIRAKSITDCTLEKWAFKYKAAFFEEVFGIKCEFIVKGLV